MGERHAFWVIVTGTTPTAFRSRYREDLLPTLTQILRTAPDAVLQWFDRGRLWESPAAARDALEEQRRRASSRGRDWRPGGQHKDPRAKYQLSRDQKRARFKKRQTWGRPETRPPAGAGDFFGDDQRNKPASGDGRQRKAPKARPPWQNDRPRGPRPPGRWSGGKGQASRPPGRSSGRPAGRPPRGPGRGPARRKKGS